MKKRSIWFLIAGVIILILAFVLRGQDIQSVFIYTTLLDAGFIAILYSAYLYNQQRDGRSKRIGAKLLIGGFVLIILSFALPGLSVFFRHALMNAGYIAIGYSVYLSSLPRDERSKRIGARSLAWSWIVTYIVLVLLLWYSGLRPGSLTVHRVLFILFWTMLVSTAIFYRWLYHRGGNE